MMTPDPRTVWHPIASSSDLPLRHVCQAQLLGREFAVWRADDGHVNVWENRCLHRGVRLSIGTSDGRELKCRYHGWRYANRTAGCTYIPAHPVDAPARTICNNTYPAQEIHGLIWCGEHAVGAPPGLEGFESFTVLRPIPVNAPGPFVAEALLAYSFSDDCDASSDERSVTVRAGDGTTVRFFVQPCDSDRSVIRGLVNVSSEGPACVALLHHHNRCLNAMRRRIEARASLLDRPEPMSAPIERLPEDLVDIPAASTDGRVPNLRVRVARKTPTAKDVVSLRLEATKGERLPTFQPGAHIDVHLQNGLVRQYSLTNGPGETDHYTIGVKREPDGRGGSATIHDSVGEGDVLAISSPRNNFPLRRDSVHTIFVAGGIGVTPLLSMARTLGHQGLGFEFHYFVRSDAHVAFRQVIDEFGEAATLHKGLLPDDTVATLRRVLAAPGHARSLYICGPGPMLEAARRVAADSGWTDESVHFEYFKNTTEMDDSGSFVIELARSAVTLEVPAGKSILEVLRENGINMSSSCEQGACGTCRCGVIEGAILHQDVYLSGREKAEGKSMMTCVSRAKSDRLILDI